MPASDIDETVQSPVAIQALLLLGALAIMAGLMYYSYIYPYPNGRPPDFLRFVLFWLREFLIMVSAALGMLLILAGWCVRLVKRIGSRTP
jgi:hypothetical protein